MIACSLSSVRTCSNRPNVRQDVRFAPCERHAVGREAHQAYAEAQGERSLVAQPYPPPLPTACARLPFAVPLPSRNGSRLSYVSPLGISTSCPQDLPPGTVDRIRQITRLDSIIYDAAIAAFEGELSRAQATPEQAAEWEREKGEFERMQRALRDTLGVGGPCAAALKHWYALDDLGYEGKVEPDGFVRLHPALGYEAMRRAWEGSGGARFCG